MLSGGPIPTQLLAVTLMECCSFRVTGMGSDIAAVPIKVCGLPPSTDTVKLVMAVPPVSAGHCQETVKLSILAPQSRESLVALTLTACEGESAEQRETHYHTVISFFL